MFHPRSAALLLLASTASAGFFAPLALCQGGIIGDQTVVTVGHAYAITGLPYSAQMITTQV